MSILASILVLLATAAPFAMPPNAVVTEGKPEGGGWRQSGEMPCSYRQTCAQFASRLSAAGWSHKHTIPLAKGRTVEAWERGGKTLTLMVWGVAPDKTGFSWGLSAKQEQGAPATCPAANGKGESPQGKIIPRQENYENEHAK